jgi:RNA polymerase sigma-70 factor (ECF subfamily)
MTMLRAGDQGSCAALDGDVDIDRDRGLVLLAQSGQRAAFDELYELYHRRLWRFCFKRLQDEHEAEDVVQEAFLRAWRALPGFGGDRRFYPWLSVIAAHLCTNTVRKRSRADPAGDLQDQEALSWDDSGEDRVIAAHDGELASRALARLSPRHQLVLDLREGRGWSYRRIAEHQGIGIPAVESLLWRAREALKREFSAQAGEGWLAGVGGAALLALRRWWRAPQAAVQQSAGYFPAASSILMSSAAAAVTAVAVGMGTLVPSLGAEAPPGAALPSAPLVTSVPGTSTPLWSLALAEWPSAQSTPAGAAATSGSGAGGTPLSAETPAGIGPSAGLAPPTAAPTSVGFEPQLPSAPAAPTPPSVPASAPGLPADSDAVDPSALGAPAYSLSAPISAAVPTATATATSGLPSDQSAVSSSPVPSSPSLSSSAASDTVAP